MLRDEILKPRVQWQDAGQAADAAPVAPAEVPSFDPLDPATVDDLQPRKQFGRRQLPPLAEIPGGE